MDIALSSKIIESILLGIEIPYLLVYDKLIENNYVTEVVDGQQRLLAIIGFLQKAFRNEKGKLEYSNKNGYALKDLRILTEFNNLKAESPNEEDVLSTDKIRDILNTTLYISKAKESENNHFSAIDHFVRLNKNICPIKENSYRMWCLTADKKILDYENKLTLDFVDNILPRINLKKTANTVTMKLACLFYYQSFSEIKLSNYTNNKVSIWLKDFNSFRDKNIFKDYEEIKKLRMRYFNAFDDTREFYLKLEGFLKSLNKSIKDLLAISNSSIIPLSNYYYLFCMLRNISKEDLMDHSNEIYDIIHQFFTEVKINKLENKDILRLLSFTVKRISIFHSYKRSEFKIKLGTVINNS